MKKHLTLVLALLTILSTSAHAQLPSYLPADGLVGWWPFNGNANDESGNGNDGVVNGAVFSSDRFGNIASSAQFDSNSAQYISTNIGIHDILTFSLWYSCDSQINYYPTLLDYGNSTNSSLPITRYIVHLAGQEPSWINTFTGRAYIQTNVANQGDVADNEITTNDEWHNLVCIFVPGEASYLYIDGIYKGSDPISNVNVYNGSLYFGRDYDDNSGSCFACGRYQGLLDDIAIYNRALTEQEIQNLYTATNTGNTVDTGDGASPLPQGIPYQAAARDAQGQVIADAPVNVRFSLHEGAVDGPVSYSETHALTTNGIGLFNTVFGNGTPEQSAFDSINWAATTKFLQVEVDLGNGYVDMGTTQLLSVPYAFRSAQAANIKNAALPIYPDNTAALAGGLVAGEMYRTATGDLKVVY